MRKNNNQMPPIVCFSGTDWWYHNRGLLVAQIMTRIAKAHTKVLYINSLGMRVPSLKQDKHALKKIFRKLKSILKYLRKDKESSMYILSPISIPFKNKMGKKLNNIILYYQIKFIMRLLGINKPIFYVGNLPAWEVVKKYDRSCMIYENSDLYTAMPEIDLPYITLLNDTLIRESDLVIYVNTEMWKSGMKINKNSILLGHGVDFNLFVQSKNSKKIPDDISLIPRPIVGFYGDISARTSDISLLEYTAKNLPDVSLVLIGPISTDVTNLRNYKNVYLLGQKSYKDIPLYGKTFDVAIMAWNQNEWIKNCNPVKTKEYLALGKPIVSVYYPEIEPYLKLVYVAQNYREFVLKIKKALKENDKNLRQKRVESVKNETWDSKVDQLITILKNIKNNSLHQLKKEHFSGH